MKTVPLILIGYFSVILLIWTMFRIHNQNCGTEIPSNPQQETLKQIIFKRQASRRSERLREINIYNGNQMARLYNILVPEVLCENAVRVGNVDDGGKWACNPDLMKKKNCSIYSLGLANEISFDIEIQQFNGNQCKIYGYDMSRQSEATVIEYAKINGKIEDVVIAPVTDLSTTPPEYAIADLVHENGDTEIEILKMDLEGGEYVSLMPLFEKHKPCQILLEMHGNAFQMKALLIKISSSGYFLFSSEINGEDLTLCEYSFIHESCMKRFDVMLLAPYIKNSA